MNNRALKNALSALIKYPIHPQWYTRTGNKLIRQLSSITKNDNVLDIGCYDKWALQHINHQSDYIGLDYPETSKNWYFTEPDVLGDAHYLPFKSKTFSTVLLLDVLEHLEHFEHALNEINRILFDNGKAIIQIPFLYPIHDSPRDFTRLTKFGLRSKLEKMGFKIVSEDYFGEPLQTATLLKNIAISKIFLNMLKRKHPLFLFVPLLPFYFLFQNLFSFLISSLTIPDDLMPISYLFVIEKQPKADKTEDNTP